jgi:hypothetical protein
MEKRLTDGYTITTDGRSITCKRCGMTSHNLNDVRNRYCGHCKLFHEDEEAPLTACVLYIFQPGIAEPDIHNSRLPAKPSYKEIKALMLPLIEGAEYPEHVSVLFKGAPADMFVDETGVLKGLPRNEAATAIYRANWLKQHPEQHPETLPHVAGTAVVTGRRIWF